MLEIGKMRERLTIEQSVSRQNARGENVPVWEEIRQVQGHLRHLGGRQLQLAQASTVTSTATHLVSMRYVAGLSPSTTRLRLDLADGSQRLFKINAIEDPDNRHAELHLTVTEVTR